MATLRDVTTVDYSGDLRVDALLYESVDWNYLLPYRTTLYFTFDLSVVNPSNPAAVSVFNASQRAAAMAILDETARITGISFAQVASGTSADLHFGAYNLAGGNTAGLTQTSEQFSYGSGNVLTSYQGEAFVFLDNAEFAHTNSTLTAGSEGYEVLLHEIGHALGLGHPFDGLYRLPASEDNTNNTVMSYTHVGANKTTYQWYDLLALRWMFGEDGLRGSYGLNSVEGPSLAPQPPMPSPVNQTVTGTAANDVLSGGSGNDQINGGAGVDTAVYSGRFADYGLTYQRATGQATLTDHRVGGDGRDQLTSIERLQFADKTFELLNMPRTVSPAYGHAPSFLFDAAFYLLSHPDLVPTYTLGSALAHYNQLGASQGHAPNVWFDALYYANKWPDLKPLNLDAQTLFAHYNLYGVWEGRSAGPEFDHYDGARYLQDNPDVAAYVDANVQDFLGSRSNGAIAHYVIYGADEARVAYSLDGTAIDLAIVIGI